MAYIRLAGSLKHVLTVSLARGDEPPALAARGRCSVTSVVGYADAGSTHANRFGKRSNRKPKTLQVHRLDGGRC